MEPQKNLLKDNTIKHEETNTDCLSGAGAAGSREIMQLQPQLAQVSLSQMLQHSEDQLLEIINSMRVFSKLASHQDNKNQKNVSMKESVQKLGALAGSIHDSILDLTFEDEKDQDSEEDDVKEKNKQEHYQEKNSKRSKSCKEESKISIRKSANTNSKNKLLKEEDQTISQNQKDCSIKSETPQQVQFVEPQKHSKTRRGEDFYDGLKRIDIKQEGYFYKREDGSDQRGEFDEQEEIKEEKDNHKEYRHADSAINDDQDIYKVSEFDTSERFSLSDSCLSAMNDEIYQQKQSEKKILKKEQLLKQQQLRGQQVNPFESNISDNRILREELIAQEKGVQQLLEDINHNEENDQNRGHNSNLSDKSNNDNDSQLLNSNLQQKRSHRLGFCMLYAVVVILLAQVVLLFLADPAKIQGYVSQFVGVIKQEHGTLEGSYSTLQIQQKRTQEELSICKNGLEKVSDTFQATLVKNQEMTTSLQLLLARKETEIAELERILAGLRIDLEGVQHNLSRCEEAEKKNEKEGACCERMKEIVEENMNQKVIIAEQTEKLVECKHTEELYENLNQVFELYKQFP